MSNLAGPTSIVSNAGDKGCQSGVGFVLQEMPSCQLPCNQTARNFGKIMMVPKAAVSDCVPAKNKSCLLHCWN